MTYSAISHKFLPFERTAAAAAATAAARASTAPLIDSSLLPSATPLDEELALSPVS